MSTPASASAEVLNKRSVSLSGPATSLALEPEFWSTLEALAAADGVTLAALIVRIDRGRGRGPLASACRLAALRFNGKSDEIRGGGLRSRTMRADSGQHECAGEDD